MSMCNVCNETVKRNGLQISCNSCKLMFHGQCVKLNKESLDFLKRDRKLWLCSPCTTASQISVHALSTESTNIISVDASSLLSSTNSYANTSCLDTKFIAFEKKIENLVTCSLQAITDKIDAMENLLKQYEIVLEHNKDLRERITNLETRLDKYEQNSLDDTIVIYGIPEEENENIMEITSNVLQKCLELKIKSTEIVKCFRMSRKTNNNNNKHKQPSNGIVIKFASKNTKETVMQTKYKIKNKLSTLKIGFTVDQPVYINEMLTKWKRELFVAAKEIKKQKNIKYIWMRDSKIMMRRADGDKVIYIKNYSDLSKL